MRITNWLKIKFQNLKLFFQGVYIEGKKVDWPSRQETIKYTLIVIGISVAVAAFLGGLDFVFMNILEKFIF
ncbi:MAG: preprotein translocase subunit SecE [Parcubacteria group bacterium CG2_30_36_21]|uniref:Protein translocase subunit SecE n=3 Tax=Candidatus Gribaldobacteria TaxID=2798536 RepID=A0A2M7VJZ9_9BACT|nr:MAG: preprotein translocase subunit SecE [Parcubacteria group bacterium CG2_30_36_21]PIR90921.1 MAG: preprotein translocase subunit SecE [bacterium (Candidatus Gribaldobacteria) CG10_big_fil_rev_8_21_14_0_10_37_46]PIV14145.1 MAG: preprotein translocase subunit SecE [bacterium (Candidatus Gribaldobacteria) CG03_land_8_20_14_0_80_36_40]PJA01989.1 MAG: preprotein translocase subunit SecE [bacterium (Candidatus Gribaldobacteria) CG_4_10_14_0_2_um_filter_36_18]